MKNGSLRTGFLITAVLVSLQIGSAHSETPSNSVDTETTLRGPLKIKADETISTEKGEIIEARGNVFISYEMESKDEVESFSQFAKYYEKEKRGELAGDPKAIWKRKFPEPSVITLTAEKIKFNIQDEELAAQGNVLVHQTSSTLKADEILYSNRERKLEAKGKRPEFNVQESEHQTQISANNIEAWTEKKEIRFDGDVQGLIYLKPHNR
ncbi:MAG: hypothetical protein HYY63_07360 [Elusimicrobia bacterium]|nr:hypothetical protein [Elusimicrobiota bacterium]